MEVANNKVNKVLPENTASPLSQSFVTYVPGTSKTINIARINNSWD